jgi:hypothetical protein
MKYYYLLQGLYIAPVAKSTIAPGKNNTISAIKAPALISRAGCPAAGLVR